MTSFRKTADARVAIVGLGYVGLPLAVEFGKHLDTLGFDIDAERIAELKAGNDRTLETDAAELAEAKHLRFSTDLEALRGRDVYIVTVPTPIDAAKRPDISALRAASRTVGQVLGKGAVVVYESTVYPGCTEEDCAPILEQLSGLKLNKDFFVGYSPERINPGDKEHRLPTIRKITAGSTPAAAAFVNELYATIITAGTYPASSIRVAEAAKVIENTQRDVNIALINELALIFNRMGLDTLEVLQAAGTKWNFLPFRPGLVGGHCIGVDPYYLTHKSQEMGYHPEMILAGRRINDNMGLYVASQVIRLMVKAGATLPKSRILVLGITFKENCPDVRNTRVVDVVHELKAYGATVDIYDPWADAAVVKHEYGLDILKQAPAQAQYDGIVVAVAHDQFREMAPADIHAWGRAGHVLYDIKSLLPPDQVDARL
ncbi:MAG: Vi polysaccharide biosynthesis UDP-N-acetylglucosamine C-6 dehydrogenase TviB [Gammaproteobacteria bacterium]|nr:Vi polysaccharide biosynthesis UDP-N-acetylglucosamine C-6 dehydrogenase TviB [Gammaproteobacteria bacterium]